MNAIKSMINFFVMNKSPKENNQQQCRKFNTVLWSSRMVCIINPNKGNQKWALCNMAWLNSEKSQEICS